MQLGTQSMTYPKPALILHTFEGSMIQDSEGTPAIAGPTMFPDTLKAIPSCKRHANDQEVPQTGWRQGKLYLEDALL